MTKIEWTEATWNPIVGCTIATPGCTNCYAMRAAWRMSHNPGTPQYHGTVKMVNGNPVWTGKMALVEKVLTAPLHRKKPTTWFVNSMGDLFHENVPDEWIDRVFAVMALCPQHRFQILTKRSARMREYFEKEDKLGNLAAGMRIIQFIEDDLRVHVDEDRHRGILHAFGDEEEPMLILDEWPLKNVWLGVSVEDQRRYDERRHDLRNTPTAIRFYSFEPLLGNIVADFAADRVDWVIVGGESGRGARPMHPDWARDIRDQCVAADVPFFFKQWGNWIPLDQKVETSFGVQDVDDAFDVGEAAERNILHLWDDENGAIPLQKKAAGRLLDGREWSQMPGGGA